MSTLTSQAKKANIKSSQLDSAALSNIQRVQECSDRKSASLKYCVGPMEAYLSPRARLEQRLDCVHSMLTLISGDGFERFSRLNDNIALSYIDSITALVAAAMIDSALAEENRAKGKGL